MKHNRWLVFGLIYSLLGVTLALAEHPSVEHDMEEEVLLYETFDMDSFPGGDNLPDHWGEYVHGPDIYVYGGYFRAFIAYYLTVFQCEVVPDVCLYRAFYGGYLAISCLETYIPRKACYGKAFQSYVC